MQVTVSGKQVDIGEAFPAYAEELLDDVVDKYFDSGIDSNVTVSKAGNGLRIDISVHPGRGIVVQSIWPSTLPLSALPSACGATSAACGTTIARKNPRRSKIR